MNNRIENGKGFVELQSVFGSDREIAEAARVSLGNETREYSEDRDRRLIRYLLRHRHTSPFEMAEVKLMIQCPIYVWRQWVRHRTASINEISGRYTEIEDNVDLFREGDWRKTDPDIKQGSSQERLQPETGRALMLTFARAADRCFEAYKTALDSSVCKEQARTILPLAAYTRAIWKIDLHNLMHFLHLRLAPNAQEETRKYAQAVLDLVRPHFPMTFEAWEDYIRGSMTFSSLELFTLNELLNRHEPPWEAAEVREKWYDRDGNKIAPETADGEREEFIEKLKQRTWIWVD